MIAMQKIKFFTSQTQPILKNRKKLKQFLLEIFKNEEKTLESLIYIFCTDKYLLSLNRDFLSHDYYTDVISFDLSSNRNIVSGEIYISIDRVRDNAMIQKESAKNELHRVIFHGALHLCGYKDNNITNMERMRAEEDKLLHLYFS